MTISLIDYNMGNIKSIYNALRVVTDDVKLVSKGHELEAPDAVIVPGVGAFSDGMENLRRRGFIEPLTEFIIKENVPYLGICLGLQFLADWSKERGTHRGLGWISGGVTKIKPKDEESRVPHMGWNCINITKEQDTVLFQDFESTGTFYFVHSYHLNPQTIDREQITSMTRHGTKITASIRSGNLFGVQFHPEKSQAAGLKLLENFVEYANRGGDL